MRAILSNRILATLLLLTGLLVSILGVGGTLLGAIPATILAIPDATADRVLGQSNLTSGGAPASPAATRLYGPSGVAIHPSGRLFVVDYSHNRVLSWPGAAAFTNGAAADLVLGQSNFTSMVGSTTQAGHSAPESIATDPAGNVWVVDSYNQRVLRYSAPFSNGMNANLVLGQADFISNQPNRGLYNPTAATLWFPRGIDFDSQGKLYVADQFNNRILIFTPPFTNGESATGVIGQVDYVSGQPNQDGQGAKQNGFYHPVAVLIDSADNLYVADRDNNRVLRFPAPLSNSMDADLVIGQSDFTTISSKLENCTDNPNGGSLIVDADHLSEPLDLAMNAAGDLIVSDICNHRVLVYQDPGSGDRTADFVYGQANYTSGSPNHGGSVAANTLSTPLGLVVGVSGSLYVADFDNNRLLAFDLPAPFSCDNVAQIPSSECNALTAIYDALNGSGWLTKTNWISTTTPCNWYGVSCISGHVTQLALDGNQLQGTLPASLADLTKLTLLSLSANQISGGVPKILANLSGLSVLDLSDNSLGGTIPAELGNLSKLNELYLSNNQLSGTIPSTLGTLPDLLAFSVAQNQLTGTIPIELGNLTQITHLALCRNQLSGAIPTSLGNLTTLLVLCLDQNQLTGTIPDTFGNLTHLTRLDLCNNKLNGELPSSLGNLGQLVSLCLNDNQLIGAVPTGFGSLVNLESLDLRSNSLSGALPTTLTNLTKMSYFHYENTQLCAPSTSTFQNWLAAIANKGTNGVTCSASTPTATFTPTPTVTPTAIKTPVTPTKTPTATPISIPATGDAFENDNNCASAKAINTTGTEQLHNFQAKDDEDWVSFDATKDSEYRIEATIPDGSTADVDLEVYGDCAGGLTDEWKASFNPGVRLDVTAKASGKFHLRLANHDGAQFGTNVRYLLNVRQLNSVADNRALIIVAGRLRGSDRLQKNIDNISQQVYKVFSENGYNNDSIQYLATSSSLPGWDAFASKTKVEDAITSWAKDKVKNNGILTLYMVDHGHPELFYVDEVSQQRVTPADLNGWLNQLESAAPGVTINVVIEACQSGSFIEAPNTISKNGRLIITSTDADNDAKASQNGAYFSDQFLTQLAQGRNLAVSFSSAQRVARQIFSLQDAWLDADGNGVANEFADAIVASQRSFAAAGTLGEDWPPYIFSAQSPTSLVNFSGVITAEVQDDKGVDQVWAVVYPPDYTPPEVGQELQAETLDTFLLPAADNNNHYAGRYSGFTQIGTYRILVYAEDQDGLAATPVEVRVTTGSRVFLPLVVR